MKKREARWLRRKRGLRFVKIARRLWNSYMLKIATNDTDGFRDVLCQGMVDAVRLKKEVFCQKSIPENYSASRV